MDTQDYGQSFFDFSLFNNPQRMRPNSVSFEDPFQNIGFSSTSLDDDSKQIPFNLDEPTYIPTPVILFKKVPYEATELDIIDFCHTFGIVSDVYLMKSKGYAFVQFLDINNAVECQEYCQKNDPKIKGCSVFVFYTGKKEIYKPENLQKHSSRYLCLIFSPDVEFLNKTAINDSLSEFGTVLQVNTFQTKPPSAYVEMEDIGSAIMAKEALNNPKQPDESLDIQKVGFITAAAFSQSSPQKFVSMPSLTNKGLDFPPGINIFSQSEPYLPDIETKVERQINMITREETNDNRTQNTVMVKNLPDGIACQHLFRLFGMYGNVMKIKIFFKNPENALIEFQESSQANLAKTHLNNCPLMGNNIFVTISKNGIHLGAPNVQENNKFLMDYSDSKEHRYKIAGSKNFRNIAPPSSVLHLSNLSEDKDELFYINLFKECGRINKILPLKGETKTMLVEMENIMQSVNVLIHFHNYNIDGKFLKVSFSKYQMIKD